MDKKILVVDDEPDFVEAVKDRLEAGGYEVITAQDGKAALKAVKQEKPDAVFLDILMPGLDGLKVLRSIRRWNKRIPVYMLTAFSNEERFTLANRLEASGFIVKTSDLGKQITNLQGIARLSAQYSRRKGKKEGDFGHV